MSLGEFEQFLMFAILDLDEDAYGVAMRRTIEQRTGREISPGAVYTALDRLEKKGLVSSSLDQATPQRGGRRKKFYRLQPAGAHALRESFERLSRMADGLLGELARIADGAGSLS